VSPKQTHYKGKRTGRSILYELWDQGDERSPEELAEIAGILPSTARAYWWTYTREQKDGCEDSQEFYPVEEDEIPLRTIKGVVWCVPKEIERMECGECEFYPLCVEAVRRGWYLGCEKVLVSELLPGSCPDTGLT